ncbi:MAG: GGDEF domain-containing protein [Casimicrobium sp.]
MFGYSFQTCRGDETQHQAMVPQSFHPITNLHLSDIQSNIAAFSESELQRQVHIEKWRLLYEQSAHGIFGSLVAGMLWAGIVWQFPAEIDHTALTYWLLALVATSALRLITFVLYRNAKAEDGTVLRWQTPYVVTLVLVSLVWGVGTLLVIPMQSTLLVVTTYVFSIGLAGAALAAYGVFIWMAIVSICILLFPSVVMLMVRGDMLSLLLAIAGLWFFIVAMHGLTIHNKAVEKSFRLGHELREANRIAEFQAKTDSLTGLKNRRAFTETAEAILPLMRREQQAVSMMLIDVDGFKDVNDQHGHAVGDTALVHIAQLIVSNLRRSDLCGRLGGDEFAVLLPYTTSEAAQRVAEKLCNAIASHPVPLGERAFALTLSIGIATEDGDIEALLQSADQAMYEAKRLGKNQFAVAA